MNYHFIAIGGAVMHNLAIALHHKGHNITGSDDEIFDPAKTRLDTLGLLPEKFGWDDSRIHKNLDAVIVGMHARKNNPELVRAIASDIRVYSFPEFLYEHAKNKKRVVIGGSHGKTTITAMIMHVLRKCKVDFDYLVGAQISGFDVMVKISDQAPVMIFEGDEYLTAPFDPRPKFHLYHPHVALLSGIAWDHINVFPDFESYVEQFHVFAGMIEPKGKLVYNQDDELVRDIALSCRDDIVRIPYDTPDYVVRDGNTFFAGGNEETPLQVFGRHNMQNLAGAMKVCMECGIGRDDFLRSIASYKGAARRLELLGSKDQTRIFKDFAHSPSKLKASVAAVKEQFPASKLVACMELHTFSSLNQAFLKEYEGCMESADEAIVYFNPHTIAMKSLPPISEEDVYNAFAKNGLVIYTDSEKLAEALITRNWVQSNLLLMSSGNFDGIDLNALSDSLLL